MKSLIRILQKALFCFQLFCFHTNSILLRDTFDVEISGLKSRYVFVVIHRHSRNSINALVEALQKMKTCKD